MTTIRPATVKDIPVIQHIVSIAWPITYGDILSPEQLTYMIDLFYKKESLHAQMDNGHEFYLFSLEQQPVGFIDIKPYNDLDCKLHKIYLLPLCQGKGYGRDLLLFAISQAKKSGCQHIKLNVNRYNKARGFYERMGFTIEKQEDNPIGQGYYMNDYVMTKDLRL